MRPILFLVLAVLFAADASDVFAQARRGGPQRSSSTLAHKAELSVLGGYSWTFSRRACLDYDNCGDIDIKSSGFWGIQADVNLMPGTQLALLYNRQDSEMTVKQGPIKESLGDIAVEYWHIGGLQGVTQDNMMGYGGLTLGGTRLIYKGDQMFEGHRVDDVWKFSMMLHLGGKMYINERLGIRVSGRMPFTFVNGGFGFGFGSGGSYATIGGTGVAQMDLNGGIMLLF